MFEGRKYFVGSFRMKLGILKKNSAGSINKKSGNLSLKEKIAAQVSLPSFRELPRQQTTKTKHASPDQP